MREVFKSQYSFLLGLYGRQSGVMPAQHQRPSHLSSGASLQMGDFYVLFCSISAQRVLSLHLYQLQVKDLLPCVQKP